MKTQQKENKPYFAHAHALVDDGAIIGDGTRVWAFAHVLPGAIVGADCNICDNVFIETGAIIGDRVTIKCGVQVWGGVTLEDDVFIGPNATFTNDNFPRSKHYPPEFERTIIRKGASIGANATVLSSLTVGANAMVGAGAVVLKDVPPNAIVAGNPAHITGYVSIQKTVFTESATASSSNTMNVRGVKVVDLPSVADLRGALSFAQVNDHLPFVPKRYFIVYDVPSKNVRGEHAHRRLNQFLVCIKGSCAVVVDDGENRSEVLLDRPTRGLHVPPLVWATEYKYTPDAVLLVLADDEYDADDYIRDYEDFQNEIKSR